jgi:hypothetical protein
MDLGQAKLARRANVSLVTIRGTKGAEQESLFRDLQAVSTRSAARLQGQEVMTEADLYGQDGLPA